MGKSLSLILGGRRAGKSTYAQRLAQNRGRDGRVLFVATAEAGDGDMAARIRRHQADRPAEWDTLEEPLDLVGALRPVVSEYDIVLLDCLTLWVSNMMHAEDARDVLPEVSWLLDLFGEQEASWIVVSNEVGLGIVPMTQLGRDYADLLGRANQLLASAADEVWFVAAGLPLNLKALSRDSGA
ncbi:MAG: bifunctional adenosylcobinamide kinase/adenosylcobinamide-phosphate guanylyltransferase [Chloroflexota bacterium]|nr:bifunctional adenosylcobinamide kinase/adenosylcobinamide-phosphate guanylyltransferase [Chloroflexota bacterium]MDE2896275.1 bifunctional adenosylcobinamide kinase/adenosylcobinamide-phosphate guanylyltransferase [Chloroflexota bacterium]